MDKPIPEAVVLAAKQAAYAADPETVLTTAATRAALTAAQQPDHIVDATKMVAQQQGPAVNTVHSLVEEWRCRANNCQDHLFRAGYQACANQLEAALYARPLAKAQPMQQGGGEVTAEDLRWCNDIAEALQEAGGPTNNMRMVALNKLLRHAHPSPPSAPVRVERKYPDDGNGDDDAYNRGWNDCLDALAQQPAAVDEAMADAAAIDKAWDRFKAAVGRQPATDEAQKIIRELAALYDGLANGNSSAEERATRLAERAAALATQHQEPTT